MGSGLALRQMALFELSHGAAWYVARLPGFLFYFLSGPASANGQEQPLIEFSEKETHM